MKKAGLLLLALALLALPVSSIPSAHSQGSGLRNHRYVDNQILVKLRDEIAASEDANLIADQLLPARSVHARRIGTAVVPNLQLIQLDGSVSVAEAIRQAEADPRVEYAEPNYLVETHVTPDDTLFAQQWGLLNTGDIGIAGADIAATQAWNLTQGSMDVIVAVTDTGIDLNHPDLIANRWMNPAEVANNGIDDDGNGLVDDIIGWNFADNNNDPNPGSDFHGTHVTGIIGAAGNNGMGVTGVAWHVKLMALKFISGRNGTIEAAIQCINYATAQRKRGQNVRVINASWGGPDNSKSLRKAISKAGEAGILFVCSAGNGGDDSFGDNLDSDPEYPAAWNDDFATVLSVAALDRTDEIPLFSNYGHTTVSLGAPGAQVVSTFPGGGYNFLTGTSMAAPHVSGVAALLWSLNPTLTPEQVKQRLIATANPVLALASKSVGAGRVNAFNALTNTMSPAPLGINHIETSKKVLTIDGLGFKPGMVAVDINSIPATGKTKFPNTFLLANGSYTRFTIKLGTTAINGLFPIGVPALVTVRDTSTNETFSLSYTRTP